MRILFIITIKWWKMKLKNLTEMISESVKSCDCENWSCQIARWFVLLKYLVMCILLL